MRFSSASGGEIRRRYGLEDSKVVIYIGTMRKERYLDVLIHALSKVRAGKENLKLLMVGDGDDKSNLERLSDDLGIKDDVIFTGRVYFNEVPNFIAAAYIGVSPIPPLSFYKVSSPINMFEYLAMAKPVVANEEIPEQEEVIQESKGGILVKFEEGSFADGIIELLNNPERAREMDRKGREWVVKKRSYEVMAHRLEENYFELLRGAS
jgi:glycosyltransferase involved in cell wall biosynthesis